MMGFFFKLVVIPDDRKMYVLYSTCQGEKMVPACGKELSRVGSGFNGRFLS